MESLLVASFIAGVLTVLVPCLLPLLPVVIGGSLASDSTVKRNPYIIIGSLIASVVLFTIIIELTSSLFYIPQTFWEYFAGTLILLIGLTFIFPRMWGRLPFMANANIRSNQLLGKGVQRSGKMGDILIGLSLGPVFTTCSPTYLIIIAIVLPQGLLEGMIYLFAYALGLGVVLLFIALLGQTAVEKLGVFAKDSGWFRTTMGILMIIIALLIFTGLDKELATFLLDIGFIDVTQFELDISPEDL